MNIGGILLAVLVPASSVVLPTAGPEPIFAHLEKADQIVGMVVVDSRNQRVGKVSDLAIDLDAGRVAEVLVDTGGRLTSKQRIVAVPPQSFIPIGSTDELRMYADIDAFDGAPEFNLATWNDSTAPASVTDVYKRFHLRPYSHVGTLKSANQMTGAVTRNEKNQRLGKVDAIVVDLPTGRVTDVIVISSGFLGIKNELTAIPPQGFFVEPDSDAVILDTTKASLKAAPHFKPDDWRSGIQQTMALSSIDTSLRSLQSLNANDASTQATGDINSTNAGETTADTIITEKIEAKILLTDDLSLDARHVQVTTHDGRVTLRGVADSAKEKKQLGDIAATVVTVDHVDNQVVVKALAIATY